MATSDVDARFTPVALFYRTLLQTLAASRDVTPIVRTALYLLVEVTHADSGVISIGPDVTAGGGFFTSYPEGTPLQQYDGPRARFRAAESASAAELREKIGGNWRLGFVELRRASADPFNDADRDDTFQLAECLGWIAHRLTAEAQGKRTTLKEEVRYWRLHLVRRIYARLGLNVSETARELNHARKEIQKLVGGKRQPIVRMRG